MKEKVLEIIASLKEDKKKIYILFPRIFRKRVFEGAGALLSIFERYDLDGIFVTGYDALSFLLENGVDRKRIFLSSDIYVMNDRAKEFFNSLSLFNTSVSVELNEGEITHMNNSNSLIKVYGREILMQSACCLYRNNFGCEEKKEKDHAISLTDRKNMVFPVIKDCSSCVNLILNSMALNLFSDMDSLKEHGISRHLISFTVENEDEMEKIMKDYFFALNEAPKRPKGAYTRGHFGRGVE